MCHRGKAIRLLMMARPRALFVHLNWTVSSYSVDFVKLLVDSGVDVDFVTTSRSAWRFVTPSEICGNVITLFQSTRQIYDIAWKMWRVCSILLRYLNPLDPFLRFDFSRRIEIADYDFVIAVEKESLLACSWLKITKSPPVFVWSLELYNSGYPQYYKYRRLNEAAIRLYDNLSGFVIQDKLRWGVIKRDHPSDIEPFYLPVCTTGDPISVDKISMRTKFGLPIDRTILIAHGIINQNRGLEMLIEIAEHLGNDAFIVVQGQMEEAIPKNLPDNIRFLSQSFAERDLMDFIAMADIGLALYLSRVDNDRLIAFSSHKLAIYARCGIPYIAIDNESYDLLDQHAKWGERITQTSEIAAIVQRIRREPEKYVAGARAAYSKIYNIDAHAETLIDYISTRAGLGEDVGRHG
jgi:hypothetical protein